MVEVPPLSPPIRGICHLGLASRVAGSALSTIWSDTLQWVPRTMEGARVVALVAGRSPVPRRSAVWQRPLCGGAPECCVELAPCIELQQLAAEVRGAIRLQHAMAPWDC